MTKLRLGFNKFEFGEVGEHLNKMPFSGVCGFVETPTDGSPCGAYGAKVIFNTEAVQNALPTMLGMGVNCVYDDFSNAANVLTGHDERFKIGVVESAEIIGNEIHITGFLWQYDFQDLAFMIKNAKDSLGFSIEIIANKIEEQNGGNLYVKALTFTGVAILYKNLAAFKSTRLAAKNTKRSDIMNEEQVKALLSEMETGFNAKFEEFLKTNKALETKIEELTAQLSEAVKNDEAAGDNKADNDEPKNDTDETLKVELADAKTAIEALKTQLEAMQATKEQEPERKTLAFSTFAKYGEGKDKNTLLAEISKDNELTTTQKLAAKLELMRQKDA